MNSQLEDPLKKTWQYSIRLFERLSLKKQYVKRFRLKYATLLLDKITFSQRLNDHVLRWLAFFNLIRNLARYQFRRPFYLKDPDTIIVLIANNNVYLHTLKPVIEHFSASGRPHLVLAPSNHLKDLKSKLSAEIFDSLIPFEAVYFGKGGLSRFLRIIKGAVFTVSDFLWFCFQPARHSISFSAALSRFSLTHYFFHKELVNFFNEKTVLLSANDHWMWESLYFTAAKQAGARSYVLQHGVIGDITYPLFADKFLAWGTADAEKLQAEFGAKSGEVLTLGSPYFDKVFEKVKQLKIGESQYDKPYITFLSQPFYASNLLEPGAYHTLMSWFYALDEIALSSGKTLLIKLHPWDKEEYYKQRPSAAEVTTEPLLDVLAKTAVAITVDSTALFEAAMFGIPVMQVFTPGQKRKIDFFSSGLTLKNESAEGLRAQLEILTGDPVAHKERVTEATKSLDLYYFELGHSLEKLDKLTGK